MDTIRELFYGNIHPYERDVPKDSEGEKVQRQRTRWSIAVNCTQSRKKLKI